MPTSTPFSRVVNANAVVREVALMLGVRYDEFENVVPLGNPFWKNAVSCGRGK